MFPLEVELLAFSETPDALARRIGGLLEKIISKRFHFEDQSDFLSWAQENLPLVTWDDPLSFPGYLSVFFIAPVSYSQNLEAFLMDLVRIRLQSEKIRLRFVEFIPFTLKKHPEHSFLVAEFRFFLTTYSELEKIRQNFPLLSREVSLFLSSSQYAETFLQISTHLPDQDICLHEAVLKLLRRWPENFEKDLIQDYHHFLGLSDKQFRAHRSMRYQLRMLGSLYLMRKNLVRKLPISHSKVFLDMRLLSTRLHFPFSQKAVLGVAIVVNLSNPYGRFEQDHIIAAVQKLIPLTQAIKESFLSFQKPATSVRSLYLEIEKTNDSFFSFTEITLLKQRLKNELEKSVEMLSPSIFGLCDVEETMRNTILLSQQLQTVSDLPQVMISFEGSFLKHLVFRIIVVRLLDEECKPLPSYFQALKELFEYIPERSSTIGRIGKKEKEATVFRLQVSKTPFLLRSDSSLNFYRARTYIYSLVTKALGEIRDYNGGIFSKQLELFSEFRQVFVNEDPELLEDFFHSINPSELQAILPLSSLTILFQLFMHAQEKELLENDYCLETEENDRHFFAFICIKDHSFQERMMQAIVQESLMEEMTAWTAFKHRGSLMLGYIYNSTQGKFEPFKKVLYETFEAWSAEKRSVQTLRLEVQDLPVSMDPRQGGDDMSLIFLKMLFEGLMRIGKDGKPVFAMAESLSIYEQGKKYVFSLRNCFWNNGDRVTAHDFCYAWKKILSPSFKTAFAYLFYDIKNAKKAKEGRISMEDIGITAFDDRMLVIELEHPCNYFLELITHPLYSPINHRIDRFHPNWSIQLGDAYICNGPFCIENAPSFEGFILKKNRRYWDFAHVMLDRVLISKATAKKALEMFEKGEIDWLGRPSRPWEPFFSERIKKPVEKLSHSLSCWCACNVQQFPLSSAKIRLALSYAVDRRVLHSSSDRVAAFTPLPFIHTQYHETFTDEERRQAPRLFKEGLKELGISREKWPTLTLIHANNEMRREIASTLVKQWKEVLGITVHLEEHDFRDLFAKMTAGNYQLGLMMWRTWVDDPLYTLNVFKHCTEEINFSKWENTKYQQLLNCCNQEIDWKQKKSLLAAAESLLVQEMPVIPVSYEAELFHRGEHVEGKFLSNIGNLDFKYVSIKKGGYYENAN